METSASIRPPLNRLKWRTGLKYLLIGNVTATILHYIDNIIYFRYYPEPEWLNPHLVDAFWFVMTPLAGIGHWLITRKKLHTGCAVLYAYAAASLLVLGHYKYAEFCTISLRIHAFIWLEAILAIILIAYLGAMQTKQFLRV